MDDYSKEVIRVEKFRGERGEDFELWAMRLMATLEGRDFAGVVNGEELAPEDVSSSEYAAYVTKVRKARAIIVNALGDKPLRAVQLCTLPKEMWAKLVERYAGKTVANQISVLTALMNLKAEKGTDMGDHVSSIESLVNRLASMGMEIAEPMQVAILLVSLSNLNEYNGTVSSIKTMDPKSSTWANVSMRIIEEQKQSKVGEENEKESYSKAILATKRNQSRATRKDVMCWECNRKGHMARDCWRAENRKRDGECTRTIRNDGNRRNNGRKSEADNPARIATVTSVKRSPKCNRAGIATRGTIESPSDSDIVVDSGASEHVVCDRKFFKSMRTVERITVEMADGTTTSSNTAGTVCVKLRDGILLEVRNVYYLPRLRMNLLSCARLDVKGITVSFENGRCAFSDRDNRNYLIGYAHQRESDNLFCATLMVSRNTLKNFLATARRADNTDLEIWHMRMGHAGRKLIETMCANEKYNMTVTEKPNEEECPTCNAASQTKSAMNGKLVIDENDITIHTDICGPVEVPTIGGKRYFATFTIARSRYCEVALLEKRSEVGEHLSKFVTWVERQAGETVKRIHSDNAKEYEALAKSMQQKGIDWTFSSSYTPQSNGLAERMNRTLLNKTRALLKGASMAKGYWGEALRHATYVFNRTSTKSLQGKSPHEVLWGDVPDNSQLRVFGCRANVFVHQEQKRGKLGDRSELGVLLAHRNGMYRILIEKTQKVVETKHVTFNEREFPMKKKVYESNNNGGILQLNLEEEIIEEENIEVESTSQKDRAPIEEEEQKQGGAENRYPRREHRAPQRFVAGALRRTHTEDEPSLRTALESNEEPLWREAINDEIGALEKLRCWDIVKRPYEKKVLHSKLVLKKKRNGDGTIAKYKARLVVCGNEDEENLHDKFAPVIDFTLVKLFLAIAIQRKWLVRQIDFHNAFVNGNLEREVYVELPKHVYAENERMRTVMRLRKSLYGLREAPKIWYELLSSELKSAGLTEMQNAPCVFTSIGLLVMCYVDDILIIGESEKLIRKLIERISRSLKTKDLGCPCHFLGMDFIWNEDGTLQLRQTKLLKALLEKTGLQNCKGISSPLTPSLDLSSKQGGNIENGFDYRSIVGSLLYLAVKTRPDIAVAASMLAQHVENPSMLQHNGAKRVLRYLKGTENAALRICPHNSNQLSAHVDSSWGGEPGFGRKSRSGVIIKYGDVAVFTASVLQKCTALSSTEAEFIALSEATKTIVWLRRVLAEFGIIQKPTVVYQDNIGSITWATGHIGSQFAKRKHVDIRYHYVVEKVSERDISVVKKSTKSMESDFLTKALHPNEFREAVKRTRIINYSAKIHREEEC